MASITVPGTAGGSVTVTTGPGDYLNLAQQIATSLAVLNSAANLQVSSVTAGASVPVASGGGKKTELIVAGAGGVSTSIPSGYDFVVNVTSSPESISASNVQLLSGDQGGFLAASGTSTVVATGGNNTVSVTGAYVVSLANGNDSVFAGGAGTIAAGLGTNTITSAAPGGPNFIIAAGTNDVVQQLSGNASVQALGSGLSVSGSGSSADSLFVDASAALGNTTVQAGSSQASVTLAGTNNVLLGGSVAGGTLTATSTGSNAIISANADTSATLSVSGANSAVFGGTGSLNLTVSGANDTVGLSTGTANILAVGNADYVFGSASTGGTLNLIDSGSNGVISTNKESATNITLSGGSTAVYGGSGSLNVSVSGTNDTITAGTGSTTVQASTGAIVFGNGAGPLTFIGTGAATPTVVGGTGGSEQVTVGAGGIFLNAGTNTNATVTSGAGQATIFGGAGDVVNFVGTAPGGAYFTAGSGNETLNAAGSTTNNVFWSNSVASATQNFVGGSGSDTLVGGAGNATLTGGAGADDFVLFQSSTAASHPSITITDFGSSDSLLLVGYSASQSASYLLAHATTAGGITLTLSDSTTVTFSSLSSTAQLAGKIGYF